jgi:hypothetical protein
MPAIDHVLSAAGPRSLRAERAVPIDVGLAHRLTPAVRWQATLFTREDRDLFRGPDRNPRLVDGVLTAPPAWTGYHNALRGRSQGIELLIEHRSSERLSGWVAYSYGRTRYTDEGRGETFWGDFDRRHALTTSVMYRVSDRTNVGLTFRSGTGFPIPGYLASRDEELIAGARLNGVRLPSYARLDVRAERSFGVGRRRVTLFADVLNVLNRANAGPASGSIAPDTGLATGFTRPLLPRLPSAGLTIHF